MSIEATKLGFEDSFKEANFYNKQTQDEKHLKDILSVIGVKPKMKVLDLGCGSGYLTFPIAKRNENASVIGLDIVTDTLKQNSLKAQGFEDVLARHDKSIIDSYQLTQTEDEIWVTEQVNNLLFEKSK